MSESLVAFVRKLSCFCLKAQLLLSESLVAFDVIIRCFPEKMPSDRQKDTE
ncbi:hypothetical protein PORCRE_1163 [Porphyromonas crevioricanis JCM 15906]|uniref:Uncharacterized protein n=1 Tax=Porphyromonas crevioricanis JCM 15906 TaxID=1305617 RepID=T1CHP1_9PORP|nr:hypothetical protein PORCRE_1163 [Porphyromonas crevioricanis JCM 15906]